MKGQLEKIHFKDPARAIGTFSRLSQAVSSEVQTGIRSLLTSSPDPDLVVHTLGRLQEERPDAFEHLTSSVAGLPFLVSVSSYSAFLSEAVLKRPEWLTDLIRSEDIDRLFTAEEYEERLEELLDREQFLDPEASIAPSPLTLALFRKQQLLRILIRDVQGYCSLAETTEELSSLADSVLEVTCRRIQESLHPKYGVPRCADPEGTLHPCSFAVLALGKLGGRELNYSSDIDLMFLYEGAGQTDGPAPIENHEFFRKVAGNCLELLSAYTTEGSCYRVDLRLRPEGRLGEICISLPAARQYYQNRARDWELQMLIKARVAAGNRELGRMLLESAEPRIYASTLDFSAVEAMSATRERISEKLAARKGWQSGLDIKLAPGGIRDIEFLVQCLQRLHGGREPWVRHGGSLLALFRLRDKGLLSDAEYSRLASAYQFLRILEHRLQCMDDRQTHTLPAEPAQLELLARKMPPTEIGGVPSADSLLRLLNRHLEEVQEIYGRVIHAQQPMYYTGSAAGDATQPAADIAFERAGDGSTSNLIRFLDQKAPQLAGLISSAKLRRGQRHFEHFLERVLPQPEWMAWLDGDPVVTGRVMDLFEHSPYFADQLVRSPELLEELRGQIAPPARGIEKAADLDELRRFYQRYVFRIEVESICQRAPIFTTLERTSDLADEVIRAAYRLAVAQILSSRPPHNASYKPASQLMTIALGRLGMREFDLASDADLVFVLPDEDAEELPFWTQVVERIIEMITAYTGYGVIFTVDTRLRPNGKSGGLVQTVGGYRDYFERSAEAWEGITYMKARAVAGDTEKATEFLHNLQEVDWRRYGQGGRSKNALKQMRSKLEREQGSGNPLKAGRGGYYDIDFALMYLRLRGAGIFYKFLNTPARIDVIEKMGHLEPADADFLRDAATFYRAVDHGLRVSTGRTEGDLPGSGSQLANLTELVCRWTPEHLHDQPLDIELAQIKTRTREFFDRLFGT